MASSTTTLLPLVDACDNIDLPHADASISSETLTPLYLALPPLPGQKPIGLLRPSVLAALEEDNAFQGSEKAVWDVRSGLGVGFRGWLGSTEERSREVKRMVHRWREEKQFWEELKGWRNELYPVYGPPLSPGNPFIVFTVERAASGLFGVPTFGIHLTAYTPDYRIWVPRRSRTKQTWPSKLDNTVAGGIAFGDSPASTVVKECGEEADLDEEFVRQNVKAVGVITYFYRTLRGWLQPEVEYVYDLPVPAPEDTASPAVIPKPRDGEVESFELLPIPEIQRLMLAGEFKYNCTLVLIDFFIRHGFLTPDNEPNFLEIAARLHRSLPFHLPS